MTDAELHGLGEIIHPVSMALSPLTSEQRTNLLLSLLTLEVCNLPPSHRPDELARIIADLPEVLRSTERGIQIAMTLMDTRGNA